MTVRISSLQYMYNYKVSLNRAYEKQTKLMEQADGQIIHRGSDDPVAYSKLLRYNVSQAENEQYQKDVKNATSFMKTEDATLSGMVTHAKTIVEKTIQAANTYNTSSDFESIGKEIYSCIEEIVSLSNTQQGDRYLFSGQKDITEPFKMSDEMYDRGVAKTLDAAQTKFFKGHPSEGDSYVYQMLALYQGEYNDNGEFVKKTASYYMDTETGYIYTKEFVEEGYKELMTLDYSTIKAAQNASEDEERYEAVQELLQAGTLNYGCPIEVADTDTFTVSMYFDSKGILRTEDDGNGTQVPMTLGDFAIPVYDSDGNVETATYTAATTKVTENKDSDDKVISYTFRDSNTNVLIATVDNTDDFDSSTWSATAISTTTLATAEPDNKLAFDTISQRMVTYSGDIKSISMVKHNGANDLISDVVNVMGQDLFSTDIFDNEESGNDPSGCAFMNDMITVYRKVLAEDVDWLNSDGVGISNAAHNSLTLSQTTIGARLQLYESVDAMLDTQSTYITEDITNISSTDVAELATRLMEMTALYNMALAIGGRILPVSLADYL